MGDANGCVRVYSGLMDMMNDNEIKAFWAMNWATSRWVTRWLK